MCYSKEITSGMYSRRVNTKIKGYILLEYLLSSFLIILLVSLLTLFIIIEEKTVIKVRNSTAQLQTVRFFQQYFTQIISMTGIFGMQYISTDQYFPDIDSQSRSAIQFHYSIHVMENWNGQCQYPKPKNYYTGSILSVWGTDIHHNVVMLKNNKTNHIILLGMEPFYQKEDYILLSDGENNSIRKIISIVHDYQHNQQNIELSSIIAFSQFDEVLAYQIFHNVYYFGRDDNSKQGIFVMHINGRHELLMPAIKKWQLNLVHDHGKMILSVAITLLDSKIMPLLFEVPHAISGE